MKKIVALIAALTLTFSVFSFCGDEKDVPYKNPKLQISERVEDLLRRLTLEEKIDLLGGTGFETKPIERLGIPALNMTDGPLGVRWESATALPSGILMGATWNPELIGQLGSVLAAETKAKKRNVILAPCVNIARIPMGGRNFESFGEDPFLTTRIAVEYIKGVQKENVAATIKHFAANNQEYQRDFVNTVVDQRTLNEIYFPAFKAAVEEAGVLAVMAAYNKLNDLYCSENDLLLIDKLKKEWDFKGLVMSDWGAVHSTVPTFNGGLDLEMPEGKFLNRDTLLDKIKNGELSELTLDEKIRRILRVMFTIGLFDDYKYDESRLNTPEHKQLALDVAREGIVLLKNENSILPLDINNIKSIAVIGPNSNFARTGGGGSSMVVPLQSVSPLQALRNKIGNKVRINFAQGVVLDGDSDPVGKEFLFTSEDASENGLLAEYFANKNLEGDPARIKVDEKIKFSWNWTGPFEDFQDDEFSVRWTGYLKVPKSGSYTLDVSADDGTRLYIDDKLVIDDWKDHAVITNSFTTYLEAERLYKIRLEYYENQGSADIKFGWRPPDQELFTKALNAAENSDLVIIIGGTSYTYESEGFDRKDLFLPNKQDSLIKEISRINKNTIVVLVTGSPVLMNEWINDVAGIVEVWFAGEQEGNAVAEVLLGEVNPSGKTPITFPVKWEDCSAFDTYMGKDSVTEYKDGIYVGYRHFERNKIMPLFPFGYGLSYTTFNYSGIKLSSSEISENEELLVSFNLKNTGKFPGSEVAQLYIKDLESSVDRPEKELKGFKKITLLPGEEKAVSFIIDKNALSFFDPVKHKWVAEPGEFMVLIGSSSQNILLKDIFNLN